MILLIEGILIDFCSIVHLGLCSYINSNFQFAHSNIQRSVEGDIPLSAEFVADWFKPVTVYNDLPITSLEDIKRRRNYTQRFKKSVPFPKELNFDTPAAAPKQPKASVSESQPKVAKEIADKSKSTKKQYYLL